MARVIKIEDSLVDSLIKFFEQERAGKVALIQQLTTEIDNIDVTITDLQDNGAPEKPVRRFVVKGEYNTNWTYESKVKFALEKAKRPLTINEIIQVIAPYDPQMVDRAKNFSAILTDKTKEGVFERSPAEGGSFRYELATVRFSSAQEDFASVANDDICHFKTKMGL